MVGCLAAASLALVLDGLIRTMEIAVARRKRGLIAFSAFAMVAVVCAGLSPILFAGNQHDGRANVVIGTKTFTEQYILAQVIADRLEAAGMKAQKLESLGSTVAFDALVVGRIDCYVDYSGTIWANYMKRQGNPGAEEIFQEVSAWLKQEHGIEQVVRLGFQNTYTLAMARARAHALDIQSIDDLLPYADQLKIGGDYEFFGRPEWRELSAKYQLKFQDLVTMDSTLMYSAVAANEVDVITAFSTDGRVPAYDLVLLEDTRGAFPPYDAMVLISAQAKMRIPKLSQALTTLQDVIDGETMRVANKHIDVDGGRVVEAAQMVRNRIDIAGIRR